MDYETEWYAPFAHIMVGYLKLTVDYSYIFDVDIKPGSLTNPFNVKSKGVLPIAILTTEDFDATTIDPVTVTARGVNPLRWIIEDIDEEGDIDLILYYDSQ